MWGAFMGAATFNGDLSEWDVSSVSKMRSMFRSASSFHGDISNWDVSDVTSMEMMFNGARMFNGDISYWDVSSVENMHSMFMDAESFDQELCGTSWVHSEAWQERMFFDSPGSISTTVCTPASIFFPEVIACL